MIGYIVRRIFQLIPVLIGISFITFALSFIIPGDPVRSIMGQRSDRAIELRIRKKFGLDKPWYIQYLVWARNLIRNPGELPQFKLKIEDPDNPQVIEFNLTRSTLLASEGYIRPITNIPYKKTFVSHLITDDLVLPDSATYGGGVPKKLISIDHEDDGVSLVLEDSLGKIERLPADPSIVVYSEHDSGGLEIAEVGKIYSVWTRKEGFQTGCKFTAIYIDREREAIDGMYDDASIGHSELRQLAPSQPAKIQSIRKKKSLWHLVLEYESGTIREVEMVPNVLLMLGGSRAKISDFKPGMQVNVALTKVRETTLNALYDNESESLPEITNILQKHPESSINKGTITEIQLSPAKWFDFGRSYRQQREVTEIIRDSFKNTAYLSTVAMLIAILIGITAGIVSAVKPYSLWDYTTMTVALLGVSMPVFWLGLMLILLFQGKLHWISGIGFGEIQWIPVITHPINISIPFHQQVILPAVTLSTVPMAIIARMTRSSMLEVMNLDYIRTARAKGLSEWNVIMRHALKNALIPIITVIGVDFAILLAGAVLTETVFSWPGMGREIVDAIEFRDFPVVMAGVTFFAFVFVAVNLIVDILYAYVDPRIRYQ